MKTKHPHKIAGMHTGTGLSFQELLGLSPDTPIDVAASMFVDGNIPAGLGKAAAEGRKARLAATSATQAKNASQPRPTRRHEAYGPFMEWLDTLQTPPTRGQADKWIARRYADPPSSAAVGRWMVFHKKNR